MWMDAGYRIPEDASLPCGDLSVLFCGHYRLQQAPRFRTTRPNGREDWQLLYVATGQVRFLIHGEYRWVTAGQAVLYRPHEPQDYIYHIADKPEVYWVHFCGDQAETMLNRYGLTDALMTVGDNPDLRRLPEQIIRDIQQCRPHCEDMTALLLMQWFIALQRGRNETAHTPCNALVRQALVDFQRLYANPFSLTAYARSLPMEPGWFSRLFRRETGSSPQAYLTNLRLTRAAHLLRSTDCPVGEVARLVGYEDPLYFSRLFARHFGVSPRHYRKSG
ncbi:MAG: helix-turn-helix transcriptional regulator [Clostridia bacterium]|nr:helix-turn-helix transcriptional regulator [Clostridia bacterium]